MFNIHKQELDWGGKTLKIETGRIARQSDGAVLVKYGDTVVLCTVVGAKKAKLDIDFFPLTVHYIEKRYAAGKIPGGFIKREGKPSDRETLISRLIDRPIRPLFPDDFHNEVQIICTVLSHDMTNDSDAISIIGASAALAISGLPCLHNVAAAKVGMDKKENFILNPTLEEIKESKLDLVVAGTTEGVLMVESEAKELSEEKMLQAVNFAHESFQPVIKIIEKLAKDASKPKWILEDNSKDNVTVINKISKIAKKDLTIAYKEREKSSRVTQLSAIREKVLEEVVQENDVLFSESRVLSQLKKLEKEVMRGDLLKNKTRIDGRKLDEIRPIKCEVNIVPCVHGSALFTRGETQSLVMTTLGTADDEQIVDNIHGEYREKFMLHYNFPPYSVGEAGRMGATSRREIGHGKLAWRSLNPIMPNKEEFPYTIRVVSEITESNGSSSMATVCGSSLSMMDAGVPMKSPVSGIAMGLIKSGKDFVVLSDILGDEDHLGDMDFKVAGTSQGITSLQMDIKITSINKDIMEQALNQAHAGRKHILNEMSQALTESRKDVSDNAPKMHNINIDKDKIRSLIGPGGKTIRQICDETNAKINISEEGVVEIAANSSNDMNSAIEMINAIVKDLEIGMKYHGTVSKILDFGAVVNVMGDKTGLVHISQIQDERTENVSDILSMNDKVWVKITDIDSSGKVRLTMKELDQKTGKEKK